MKIRTKILLVVATTAVVIAGLFVLKAYYGNKLGIFADLLTDEKIIASKTVAEGGFVNDQISNMEKPEGADYYQIAGSDSEICGNYPDQTNTDSMPDDLDFNLSLTKVTDNDGDAGIQNFDDNYYIGNQQVTQVGGGAFPLKPEGDDLSIDDPGFSITRGPGWLNVELDKSSDGPGVFAVQGSITLPAGTSLNANSISYISGGAGIENGNNGSYDLTSNNDEITVFADQRKIDFVLVTTTNTDIFVINYCFSPVSTYEGTISGQIDIGEMQPITSLRLNTADYSSPRDQVLITTEISQNGSDWFTGNERSGLRYNFQGSAPRDSYCFRYIKYQIKFKTESSDPSESVKLRGISIYGGDTCGTELPFDPGGVSNLDTACSNGLDDDGDGKIDFVADGSGDSGCTSYMDDSEEDAEKICQDGTRGNVTLTMNIVEHIDLSGVDMGKNIYVGANEQPRTSPATIQLVSDGVAVKDKSLQEKTDGLSIYRGEGYFYIHNEGQLTKITQLRGNFSINGAKIVKAINLDYEIASGEDSYSIPDQDTDNTGSFFTKVRPDSDGVYVYYEYDPAVAGGCQCQDGIDNDNNGFIDFPDDFGCTSRLDNLEARSDDQAEIHPACKNGLDDDGDGKIDYPDDTGCESAIDDSEGDSSKVCELSNPDIGLVVSDVEIGNTGLGDVSDSIFVGDRIYKPGEVIALVSDGAAIVDENIQALVPGVAIKRGPGYIYVLLRNDKDRLGREFFRGKFSISGARITKAVNSSGRYSGSSQFFVGGPFEGQGDGVYDPEGLNPLQDEFAIYNTGEDNYIDIASITNGGSDAVFVYYDYKDEVTGGCQCQDGVDNDGDGIIDYPNDRGCDSPEDNDETDKIAALVSQPAKILPSLISSGPGFWILIIAVLVISGVVIFIIIKSDKNKPIN